MDIMTFTSFCNQRWVYSKNSVHLTVPIGLYRILFGQSNFPCGAILGKNLYEKKIKTLSKTLRSGYILFNIVVLTNCTYGIHMYLLHIIAYQSVTYCCTIISRHKMRLARGNQDMRIMIQDVKWRVRERNMMIEDLHIVVVMVVTYISQSCSHKKKYKKENK